MNKLTAFLLLLALSALACSNTPAVIVAQPTVKPAAPNHIVDSNTMIVCVDALNVRLGPGTSYETTGEPLIRGIFITMTGTPINSEDGGTWQKKKPRVTRI